MSLLVMKFGGTSVGDATAMRQVARITRDAVAQWDEVVVVTSAMGRSPNPKDHVKVTDALLNAARAAAAGDDETYRRARRELSDKHHAAIEAGITSADERRVIGDEIDKFLDGSEMLCASVRAGRSHPARHGCHRRTWRTHGCPRAGGCHPQRRRDGREY